MKTLTDEVLTKVIERADEMYDKHIGKAGRYELYHKICEVIMVSRGYIEVDEKYDPAQIDSRCDTINELERDEMDK